jgi:hypothetical protein
MPSSQRLKAMAGSQFIHPPWRVNLHQTSAIGLTHFDWV